MQVVQIACLVSWQPRQYVLQVSVRIMPVHARRLDQAHDSRRSFTTAQRTGEQPVGATVDRHSTIIKLRAAHPPRAGAARRFALPIEPGLNAGWPSLLGQRSFLAGTAADGRRTWRWSWQPQTHSLLSGSAPIPLSFRWQPTASTCDSTQAWYP